MRTVESQQRISEQGPDHLGIIIYAKLNFPTFYVKLLNLTYNIRNKVQQKHMEQILTLKKPRSWHLVPSLHGKQMGKKWNQ